MSNEVEIKTIRSDSEFHFKEKGSEFIGLAYNFDSESDIQQKLNELKKNHYNATHHCFAYKLKTGEFKYSDDGEPKGSAGIRLFNAINHFDLNDLLIVVIRYYGGTKLGVGPLGKAYYHAAEGCIKNSRFVKMKKYVSLFINYEFAHTSLLHRSLSNFDTKIISEDFTLKPKMEVLIFTEEELHLKQLLSEQSNGSIHFDESNRSLWLKST
ncbi:MAG: YigZ family protein [Melioribacteraceae bacterium]|nr:YigZ family protein [Melioribacteraceae bacterium]MCF8265386.1 YigZ family protein [Melioribacteraceae bacterium]MCF8412042.1 YigZ family protein [Melioribacteraceae bacterium]MCF8432609.1 YigZ family protein [Melioribacteraceae bacterium]